MLFASFGTTSYVPTFNWLNCWKGRLPWNRSWSPTPKLCMIAFTERLWLPKLQIDALPGDPCNQRVAARSRWRATMTQMGGWPHKAQQPPAARQQTSTWKDWIPLGSPICGCQTEACPRTSSQHGPTCCATTPTTSSHQWGCDGWEWTWRWNWDGRNKWAERWKPCCRLWCLHGAHRRGDWIFQSVLPQPKDADVCVWGSDLWKAATRFHKRHFAWCRFKISLTFCFS